jgi:SAM-dependent methyltransferase
MTSVAPSDRDKRRPAEEARIREALTRRGHRAYESWTNPAYAFIAQDRERRVLAALRRHGFADLTAARILEIGCGRGAWLQDFLRWGASPENLCGLDLLPERIAAAEKICPPGVHLRCCSALDSGFPNDSFDLVLQATVFTSVLDPALRSAIAAEMVRLVRPSGIILWYDFMVNNPANPDVRRVGKREIHRLFPGCSIDLRRATLAPPICRAVAPRSWLGCHLLGAIPLLRTHYVGVIRKAQ